MAAKTTKTETTKAKAAPKKGDGSKTETAVAMLRKGATRAAIAEACKWPSIDIKALAARKNLRLKKDADGVITATGGN